MKKTALLLCLCLALMAGCGQQAADTPQKVFKWVSNMEDNCINPHDSGAAQNFEIVDLIQVSLYCWAPAQSRDKVVLIPALADGEPEQVDEHTWRIRVSDKARWQNGEAIDANTFIYSWQMGLDPKLAYTYGSHIAGQYIQVVGAFDYYSQLGTDKDGNPLPAVAWESVGLSAEDDRTLLIQTTQRYSKAEVMRHFSARMTSPVYQPLYEAGMNDDRTATNYGTELEYFMGCGPFKLTSWVKASQRTFERNDQYTNAHLIKLDGIECRVVREGSTRAQMFDSGEWDYISLDSEQLTRYLEAPQLRTYDQKTIRTLEVNQNNPEKPILQDPLFRKALYHAIDRDTLAQLTYTAPAPFFLSTTGISFSDGTRYRQMPQASDWLPENGGYDPELARQYFDEAMDKWGLDSLSLGLTYSEGYDSLRLCSEYLQKQLPQVLGEDRFSLSLSAMQHQALNAMMRTSVKGESTEWDLSWSGLQLAAETLEPHKKLARYLSTEGSRFTNYSNDFLDQNYPLLLTEEYRLDEQKTFELTVALEKSVVLDDVTAIPVIQEKSYVLFSPRTRLAMDAYVSPLGYGWEYMDLSD